MSTEDRNPSPPPVEILEDDEDIELLHADSIEGTAFSKKWTLATLVKLGQEVDKEHEGKDEKEIAEAKASGIDISDDLENDLCKLWDMSANTAVSKYLEEWKTVEMLLNVIMKSNAPRLVEICIGILGNMACSRQIALNFSENKQLRDVVLATLGSSDAPTLIETTRLLTTCLGTQAAQELWLSAISSDEEVFNKLCFILKSSTNCDLLHATANLMDTVMDVDEEILSDWANTTFIQGVAEALNQTKKDKPETVAILLHTLQLLSTIDMGVETLVECTETILSLVTEYISSICELDDVISIYGKEHTIASAVSVLDVLANTSPPNIDAVLKHNKQTLPHLLHILSAAKNADTDLPKKDPASSSEKSQKKDDVTSSGDAAPASGDAAPTSGDAAPTSGDVAPTSGDAAPTSGDAAPASGNAAPASGESATNTQDASGDDSDVDEIMCVGVVTKEGSLLTDVLMEFFCNLLENSEVGSSDLSTCLESCNKNHVDVLRQSLTETQPELLDVLNSKPSG